jgi:hypothetical protein
MQYSARAWHAPVEGTAAEMIAGMKVRKLQKSRLGVCAERRSAPPVKRLSKGSAALAKT